MGTPAKHGKKRKSTTTPTKSAPNSGRKARKLFETLTIDDFCSKLTADRLLSCGEGEQLGHPGRNTTKKPRAVDTFPQGTTFVQVAAGGVHSLVLTIDGVVYSCGVNEKGTVPVEGLEAEETIDKFSEIVFSDEIKKLGKIVQITAGASFSAALTEKGSVIAWGNLRDTQGEVNVHETLKDIQKKPAVVIRHKSKENWHIVKIAAGENHLAMLSNEGELLTFGEGSMGQLGRTTRTQHIRSKFMVDESGNSLILRVLEKHQFIRFVDVWAQGFWTIGRAQDGRLFVCGLNNFGQLGVMPSPKKKSTSGKGRRSASQHKNAAGEKDQPATMEALNFDELDISVANQVSSEDSSQEPDEEEHKQNGDLPTLAGTGNTNNSQIPTTSANAAETEMQNPKHKEGVNEGNPKIIGQEEANKVALLTWAEAFPADKKWKHISGVQHIVCCTEEGELYGIGKNTDNALGLGTWEGNQDDKHWRYDVLQHIPVPNELRVTGVDATLGASIFWTDEGKVYGFGCDTVGQLGLGIKDDDDDKIVPVPRQITSAHLDGFRVISVSMADNHSLFLASSTEKKIQVEQAKADELK